MYIFSDRRSIVECDGIRREFDNLQALSNGINEITSKYFTVNEIQEFVYDRILFLGFQNNSTYHYTLFLRGIHAYHPCILLSWLNSSVNLPYIKLEQISLLSIYSNHHKLPNSGEIDYKDLNNIRFNDRKLDPRNLTIHSNNNNYCVIV